MAFEIITLNLIPDGEMPVFHASQFDTARPVIIDLVMGEDAYVVPEGITLELHCRKVDDTIVTMEPDEVTGNRVTFVTTEQLTACIGDNLCEVALLNGDDHIGTLNFILHVEPDPLAGGLTSETDIYNLTQQIEDIAEEVIGEDYYDKTEVDNLLSDKADIEDLPDMSRYYTKNETYSKEQVYNKEETYSRVQMSENYYNKSESRAIFASQTWVLNQMQLEGTASGAIASFETAAPRQWLTSLKCNMLASGGGGTPDNPIPIVGFTECNITACGKNFVIGKLENINIEGSGEIKGGQSFNGFYAYVVAGNTYAITTTDTNIVYAFFEDLPEVGDYSYNNSRTVKTLDQNTFTAPINGWIIFRSNDLSFTNAQLELGSTASEYEPYNGQTVTIDLNGTRYGGYVDVNNGKLVVTMQGVDLGSLTWSLITGDGYWFFYSELVDGAIPDGTLLSEKYEPISYNSIGFSDNKIAVSGTALYVRTDSTSTQPSGGAVYELATPIEIDISPEHLDANVGQNNVFHDCNGTTEVKYKDTIQHYIDTRL